MTRYSRRTFMGLLAIGSGLLATIPRISHAYSSSSYAKKMPKDHPPVHEGKHSAHYHMMGIGGIIYSEQKQGKWQGKAGSHAPQVHIENGKVEVLTPHGMSEEHFIVRHTIVNEKGEQIAAKTYSPKDAPTMSVPLPPKGKYIATSFCNLHDLWITHFEVH